MAELTSASESAAFTAQSAPARKRGAVLAIAAAVLAALVAAAAFLIEDAPEALPADPALVAEADALAAVLRDARAEAIATNRTIVVHIDAAAGSYRVGDAAEPRRLEGVALRAGPDATAAGGVRFAQNGGSDGARLELARDGRVALVTVDWLTGAVTVTPDAGLD